MLQECLFDESISDLFILVNLLKKSSSSKMFFNSLYLSKYSLKHFQKSYKGSFSFIIFKRA
jgi:hypothetical protein